MPLSPLPPARGRLVHPRLIIGIVVGVLLTAVAFAGATPVAHSATIPLKAAPGQETFSSSADTIGDGTARVAFVIPKVRSSRTGFGVQVRGGATAGYQVRVRVSFVGTMTLKLVRMVAGQPVVLGEYTGTSAVAAGSTLWVEASVAGAGSVALKGRAWPDGQAAPSWQLSTIDTLRTRIQSSGAVQAVVARSPKSTSAASMRYYDLTTTAAAEATTTPSSTPTATSTPTTTTGTLPEAMPTTWVKPTADTTGVPAGTTLTRHDGTIVVTKDNTVIDSLDVHGFIIVKAANVTIRRSIVRGGHETGTAVGLITDYGYPNLLVEDTRIEPEFPSVYFDGIKGSDFTARRVHVSGTVDSIKIHGDDVRVESSLLEKTVSFDHDPYQNNGPTHNDNIQILWGKNLTIIGNTIRDATNFPILGAANGGDTSNLVIDNNWLDGGHCTLKLQSFGSYQLDATVEDNKFGPDRAVSSCPMQVEPQVISHEKDNVFEANGLPVPVVRKRF